MEQNLDGFLVEHRKVSRFPASTGGGWIGVDLDGTLAEYHGWNDGKIGPPIPAMVERVKRWLDEGKTVKILTARVSSSGHYSLESKRFADAEFVFEQHKAILRWCIAVFGCPLEVTASKDFKMIELWDDRAVTVEPNTGKILTEGVKNG